MKNRIGRNDPCPCGSGKKYKKCHLLISKSDGLPLWKASDSFKKTFEQRYCLCPEELKHDCSGKIINAHTISKSQNLKPIAKNQHVYGLSKSLQNAHRSGGPNYELQSINKASTFTGFCSFHDNSLFEPLEKLPFVGSKEQCFLLAYRIISRELFLKKISLEKILSDIADHQFLDRALYTKYLAESMDIGRSKGENDLEIEKKKYDEMLLSKDFSKLRSCIFYFKKNPTIMFAGATVPIFDFEGNKLFDLANFSINASVLTFSSLASASGGCVVFSWIESDNDNCERFMKSLKNNSPSTLTDAIINFIYETCENHFMSPEWWDSLANVKREKLLKRFYTSIKLSEDIQYDCLCKLTSPLDDWGLTDIVDL